ncbi:ABC transporter permease subunit [Actinoallomurus spadix]|uniref:ABC transporter permease n=1 Tax=Actinoallomurus spadix TaxID=79912 RepID=UPI0020932A1B|nr:ABC transporter permease subunit [Actinoallomurus spadix]MCO5986079.1 ABC transporter permease subunit [Actinoallomurus spadix]
MPRRSGRVVRGLIGVFVLFLAGEVLGRTGLVDRSYLPPSSVVLVHAGRLLVNADFLRDVLFTLGGWSSGLVIAVVIAVPAGLVIGSVPIVNSAARVLVEFLRPIPAVALAPLVVLFIASQSEMERTLAAYAAMWPILMNTIYGVGDVDPVARDMARCFGLRPSAVLLRIALPSVAPFVATGVRLASSVALIVTISTELIYGSGGGGLGQYIFAASGDPDGTPDVFAAVAITGALGLALDLLLTRGERRAFRWHFDRLGKNG